MAYCFSISRTEGLPPVKRSSPVHSFAIHDILGLGSKDAKPKSDFILQSSSPERSYGSTVNSVLDIIPEKFSGKFSSFLYILARWELVEQEISLVLLYRVSAKTAVRMIQEKMDSRSS